MITENLQQIITDLQQSKIVSIPTDTVYGLSCCINKKAVNDLIDLKMRDSSKGFIIISSQAEQLLKYIDCSKLDSNQINKITIPSHEPTTWIVPAKDDIQWLTGGFNTLAVRLVDTDIVSNITNQLKDAIISTSANISNQSVCKSIADIDSIFPSISILKTQNNSSSAPSKIFELISGKQIR